jgi:hypothetical protein
LGFLSKRLFFVKKIDYYLRRTVKMLKKLPIAKNVESKVVLSKRVSTYRALAELKAIAKIFQNENSCK